jgi:VanZ family protein
MKPIAYSAPKTRIRVLLFTYIGYLLIAGLYPFDTSLSPTYTVSEFLHGFLVLVHQGLNQFWTRDFFENILLFTPFGIILYYSLISSERSKIVSILLIPVFGCLFSFSVELLQVFFPDRYPSASDVLADTLGATVGGLLAGFLPMKVPDQAYWFWAKVQRSKAFLFMALLYGILPSFLLLVQFPWFNFSNWDSRSTFQMGNEATLDAPWLGKLYLIALYNRALSPAEIAHHFQVGFSAEAPTSRTQEGLIALYTFSEGAGDITHDLSTFGSPLDLTFTPASHVRWLRDAHGIEIPQPAIIKGQGPATKLFTALSATSALSIEVWMSPLSPAQTGPARIVSFSQDPFHSNFTLGQYGADIHFQLRTPISGKRGSPVNLKTNDEFLTTNTFHIVANYEKGIEKLYMNGRAYRNSLNLAEDAIVGFYAIKRPIAQIAYTFFYFFPVSFFLSMYFSTWSRGFGTTWLLALIITISLLSTTEIFQAVAFDRGIDLPLIGYGVLTGSVGVFSGETFARGGQVQPWWA